MIMSRSLRICMVLSALLLLPLAAYAAEISGVVRQTAGPYLLLQTESGERVVRTDTLTTYGNLVGFGALKFGGERVRVEFDAEVAGVPRATVVTRDTEYAASGELTVTVEQVVSGITDGSMMLLDCRSRREWEEGRLPGALLYAGPDEVKQGGGEAGKRKNIVLYGSSTGDLRPFAAARELQARGHVNVRIYGDGVTGWRQQGKGAISSPANLQRLLDAGTPFRLIGLQRSDAAQPLLLAGSELLPLAAFTRPALFLPERAYQLPLFLYGEEIDLQRAAGLLAEWGYHNDGDFTLLDPSWQEWRGKFQAGRYLLGTLPPGEIGYAEFRSLWSAHDRSRSVLLNVKPKGGREVGGEIHIPLEELPERLGELPRDREIIIYCSVGLRSAVAQRILKQNGISSRFLNRALRFDSDNNPHQDTPEQKGPRLHGFD